MTQVVDLVEVKKGVYAVPKQDRGVIYVQIIFFVAGMCILLPLVFGG